MRRFIWTLCILLSLGFLNCGKDFHDEKKMLYGDWQKVSEGEVAGWNTSLSAVVFVPATGCNVTDVFSFSKQGKYTVQNSNASCSISQSYDYTFDPGDNLLTIGGATGSSSRVVLVLSETELLWKVKVTGPAGDDARFTRFARR